MESVQSSTSAPTQPFKIARAWNMESADKATRVAENTTMGFGDFIDLINPLQHIPIVGTLYRAITGDEIKPAMQLAGDLAYGAITGSVLVSGAVSIASLALEQESGKEPTIQIAQALFGDDEVQPPSPEAGNVQLAENENISQEPLEDKGFVQPPLVQAGNIQLAALPEQGEEVIKEENLFASVTEDQSKAPVALGGVRLGNMIYTDLVPRATAKANQSVPEATLPQDNKKPVHKTAKLDSQTLGLMIHEQAAAQKAGNELPPELVRDMMLMALDKYKTAQNMPEDLTAVQ